MLLIRLSHLTALVLCGTAGTVGASVAAYLAAAGAGRKGDAELYLFMGLLLGAFLVLGFVFSLLGADRRKKELENFSDLVKYGGSISDARLARFGAIGEQMRSILSALSEASDRKSARIASLTGLVRAALDEAEKSIMAISLDGRIIAASPSVTSAKAFKELRIGESVFADYFPDADLRAILEEAGRTHGRVERAEALSFLPVYSLNGDISHFMVNLGHKGLLGSIGNLVQGARAGQGRKAEAGSAAKAGACPGVLGALRGLFKKKPGPSSPMEEKERD